MFLFRPSVIIESERDNEAQHAKRLRRRACKKLLEEIFVFFLFFSSSSEMLPCFIMRDRQRHVNVKYSACRERRPPGSACQGGAEAGICKERYATGIRDAASLSERYGTHAVCAKRKGNTKFSH